MKNAPIHWTRFYNGEEFYCGIEVHNHISGTNRVSHTWNQKDVTCAKCLRKIARDAKA